VALYQEGFARSLLAYELPDGRLKLIDGHLRREIDPDMEVEVEILDVNEDEARVLLSIDPLVALGQMQEQLYDRLRQTTATRNPELEAMWQATAQQSLEVVGRLKKPIAQVMPEQYMVLVMCQSEKEQLALLERFQAEGAGVQGAVVVADRASRGRAGGRRASLTVRPPLPTASTCHFFKSLHLFPASGTVHEGAELIVPSGPFASATRCGCTDG
jgi:hypothetical protein